MFKKLLSLRVLFVVLLAAIAGFAYFVSQIAPERPAQDAKAAQDAETTQSETSAAPVEEHHAQIVLQLGNISSVHVQSISSASFSSDGRTALSASGNMIAVWDMAAGRMVKTFPAHFGEVTSLAVSSDGNTALSGSRDGTIKLWDISSGRELRTFRGYSDSVTAVALSPDGRFVLSGGEYGRPVKLWNVKSGRRIRTFIEGTGDVASVAFSPDGRAALSGDSQLKLWDVESGHFRNLNDEQHEGGYSVAFSPDGRTVLSGSRYSSVKLWDVASGRLLRIFKWDRGEAGVVAFSPDGRSVLWGMRNELGDGDGTIRLWDVSGANTLWGRIRWSVTAPEPKTFSGHSGSVNAVAFSPDGRRIISSGGRSLRLWDIATGRALATLSLFDDESWLAITPEGFYDSSSPQGVQKFGVVRGLKVCSDDKVYNTLHRPDLVREQLAGDPNGKVKAAAAQLDLDKVCFGSEH